MSKINQLVEKYGLDKTLHFLVGALVVAYGFQFSILIGGISFIVIMLLEMYKEKKLDVFVSSKDIKATFYGCLFSVAVYFGIQLIKSFFIF